MITVIVMAAVFGAVVGAVLATPEQGGSIAEEERDA